MDDSALIRYYTEKSLDWIFQGKSGNYRIEDDEILDLDALSLDSNEDTWLYSSDEKPSHDSHGMAYDDGDITSSLLSSSNFGDEVIDFSASGSHSISSMSPLIDVNNCSDSLIHVPDVSPAAIDDFLAVTPIDDRKSKSYFRTDLSNQFHPSFPNTESKLDSNSLFNKRKTEYNAFQTFESTFTSSNETRKFPTRNYCINSESADKSSILHSVENKLFTITDADSNDASNFRRKSNQLVHEFENSDCIKRSDSQKKNDTVNTYSSEYKAVDFKNIKECDKKNCLNKTAKADPLKNNVASIVGENDENDRRTTSKKCVPICQSTPMLLNRYLKYNKSIEDSRNYSKWRTSSEFLEGDAHKSEYVIDKNEMNESIEHYVSPSEGEANISNSNLNTTYSKSEGLLNSTYDVFEEDDQMSSVSESSTSSFSKKPASAVRDVQKMAQLQERSLQKQIHLNCGTGSSKSSEISSSNESISAFSPLSSSNEGQIDLKTCNAYSSTARVNQQSRIPFTPNTFVSSSRTVNNVRSVNSTTSAENRKQLIESKPDVRNSTFVSKLSSFKSKEQTNNSSASKETAIKDDETKKSHLPRCASPGPVSHTPRPSSSSRIPKLRTSASCTRYAKTSLNSVKK